MIPNRLAGSDVSACAQKSESRKKSNCDWFACVHAILLDAAGRVGAEETARATTRLSTALSTTWRISLPVVTQGKDGLRIRSDVTPCTAAQIAWVAVSTSTGRNRFSSTHRLMVLRK